MPTSQLSCRPAHMFLDTAAATALLFPWCENSELVVKKTFEVFLNVAGLTDGSNINTQVPICFGARYMS